MPRIRFVSPEVLEKLPTVSSDLPTHVQGKKNCALRKTLRRAAELVPRGKPLVALLKDAADGLSLQQIADRHGTSKATESRRRLLLKHSFIAIQLVDRLALNQGVTIDPRTGMPLQGAGYLVSLKPYGAWFMHVPAPSDAIRWLTEHNSRLTHHYPGSWYDDETGKYWLDMNCRVFDFDAAMELGAAEGQEAIFDLHAQQAIRVIRRKAKKAA